MPDPVLVPPSDAYNKTLVNNVHPADWVNPEPASSYNLVVIGAGTAGLVTAAGAAGLGAKVALVEKHLMGGDCLNVGCVPSKAVIRASRAFADIRDASSFGINVPPVPSIDFSKVMERMRRLRAHLSPTDSAARFKKLGVDVFLGDARFLGEDSIGVGGKILRFRKAVIATGARAKAPAIPGLDDAGYLTNETIFTLTQLPKRLVVIGGGPIGCELAQAFARFGASVDIVQSAPQILEKEDADGARLVSRALEKDGVALHVGCAVRRAEKKAGEKILIVERGGKAIEIKADEILVASGRAPNVEGLNLEAVGVEYDATAGVKVDDRLCTTNARIFAAGDCCSRYKFTHAADAMARIVIQNALFMGRKKASTLVIPWCTYTDPEIAHVGLTERDAKSAGYPARTFTQELRDVDRAVLDGEEDGFVKVIEYKGKILGATIVARHAGDMIGEMAMAMQAGVGVGGLASIIRPYPTQSQAIGRVGDAFNKTRLTPGVKRWFDRWMSWTR